MENNNDLTNFNDSRFEIFNYKNLGSVRTYIDDNGKPWFCLNDICTILEISNITNLKERLNPKGLGLTEVLTNGGNQAMYFVDEGNLYRAIGRSRKIEAVPFMDWIYDEVIPMIRRTGMYMADDMIEDFVNHPDTFDTLVDNYIRVRNELRDAQPKLETYNRIMNSDAAFPMGTAAKIMNFQAPQRKRKSIGRNQMFQILRELNILQHERPYHNIPFQNYVDDGYFVVITKDSNGDRVNATVWVTPRGIEFIMNLLKEHGYELRQNEPIPEKYNNLNIYEAV